MSTQRKEENCECCKQVRVLEQSICDNCGAVSEAAYGRDQFLSMYWETEGDPLHRLYAAHLCPKCTELLLDFFPSVRLAAERMYAHEQES